jgi:hypothetical protein
VTTGGGIINPLTFLPPTGGGSTLKYARVSNFSPYGFLIQGTGNDPVANEYVIQALQVNVFPLPQGNVPLKFTPLPTATSLGNYGSITVEWTDQIASFYANDEASKNHGVYPQPLGGFAAITGEITTEIPEPLEVTITGPDPLPVNGTLTVTAGLYVPYPVTASGVVKATATNYIGFSIAETTGLASASFIIYDGASSAGAEIDRCTLLAGQSARECYPFETACTEVYFDLVSGTIAGTVRLSS